MKRFLIGVIFILTFVSCQRDKEIPDDELKQMVKEFMLVNAYQQGRYMPVDLDSMDIYRPVFERYGYKPRDLLYTLDNMTKRKSIRFSDILKEVQQEINEESRLLSLAVERKDTIDARIARRYKEIVFEDDTVRRFTTQKSLAANQIRLSVLRGRYEITYLQRIDSIDRNNFIQYSHYTVDTAGRRNHTYTRTLSKRNEFRRENFSLTISETKLLDTLVIIPGNAAVTTDIRRTSVAFDSVWVTRYLLTTDGNDAFRKEFSVFASPFKNPLQDESPAPKDYVTLRIDSAGFAPQGDTIVHP